MADPVQEIVERVAEIARKVATETSPVRIGTVLSVNPDGSVNVDDGQGGCARVSNVGNQVVTCGSTIVLGLEPQVGQTTDLCQVSFTIDASGKTCPVENRIDDNEVIVANYIFVDEDGNRYAADGTLLEENGADTCDIDSSYGYSFNGVTNECLAGASPTYDVLVIGDLDDNSGNQGSTFTALSTVLVLNTVSNVLMGAELKNVGGGADDNWKLVLRDPVTFAMIDETSTTNFLNTWITGHPDSFFGNPPNTYHVHISPDPEDGHFWVNPGSAYPPDPLPVFKVSSSDLSLLDTVELAVPDAFVRRAKRFLLP